MKFDHDESEPYILVEENEKLLGEKKRHRKSLDDRS
jgi:hypothetical protein